MILDRYLARAVLVPMCGGVAVLLALFFGYSASRQLAAAAERSLDLATALALVGLNTLTTLDVLLPSALFFSVLAGVGRLYREAELSAMFATGFSPRQLLWAVAKPALLVSALLALLTLGLRPWLYGAIYRLETQAELALDTRQLPVGGFVRLPELDYLFIADDVDRELGIYRDVFLHRAYPREGRVELIRAATGSLPTLRPGDRQEVVFTQPRHYLLDLQGERDGAARTERLTLVLPEAHPRQAGWKRRAAPLSTLAASAAPKDVAEYQWRLAAPLVPLLLALLAVPLAQAPPRAGAGGSAAAALAVYVAVFSFTTAVRSWVEGGLLPAVPGLWTAHLLPLSLLAALLCRPAWRAQ